MKLKSKTSWDSLMRWQSKQFIAFLRKIREANPGKRIVIILDNFRTHHAKKVRGEAEELNIKLVYLPPYSPDLNPIENIWKSVKRFVSEESPPNTEELKETISNATVWIEKFLGDRFKMFCT